MRPQVPNITATARRRGVAVAVAVAAAAAVATTSAPAAGAAPAAPAEKPVAFTQKLRFAELPMRTVGTPTRTAAAVITPLPTFSDSFTFNAQTFPYTMVGTAPGGPAATTTVANTITPMNFKFGTVTMSSPAVNTTTVLNSGLFTPKPFPGGPVPPVVPGPATETGQYGDVFMRTQFWTQITNGTKNWHVKMGKPTVRPAVTFTIPAASGRSVLLTTGVRIGVIDINFVDSHLRTYVSSPAANIFTQLLSTNIVLCEGPPSATLDNCGIGGYHSAWSTSTGKHTFSYQSFLSPKVFNDPTSANIAIFGHELAEWLADPYTNNTVPTWEIVPTVCNTLLEVADRLSGRGITRGGLFYQDLNYLPYFARQTPSTSWLGRYSWFNVSKTPSTPC